MQRQIDYLADVFKGLAIQSKDQTDDTLGYFISVDAKQIEELKPQLPKEGILFADLSGAIPLFRIEIKRDALKEFLYARQVSDGARLQEEKDALPPPEFKQNVLNIIRKIESGRTFLKAGSPEYEKFHRIFTDLLFEAKSIPANLLPDLLDYRNYDYAQTADIDKLIEVAKRDLFLVTKFILEEARQSKPDLLRVESITLGDELPKRKILAFIPNIKSGDVHAIRQKFAEAGILLINGNSQREEYSAQGITRPIDMVKLEKFISSHHLREKGQQAIEADAKLRQLKVNISELLPFLKTILRVHQLEAESTKDRTMLQNAAHGKLVIQILTQIQDTNKVPANLADILNDYMTNVMGGGGATNAADLIRDIIKLSSTMTLAPAISIPRLPEKKGEFVRYEKEDKISVSLPSAPGGPRSENEDEVKASSQGMFSSEESKRLTLEEMKSLLSPEERVNFFANKAEVQERVDAFVAANKGKGEPFNVYCLRISASQENTLVIHSYEISAEGKVKENEPLAVLVERGKEKPLKGVERNFGTVSELMGIVSRQENKLEKAAYVPVVVPPPAPKSQYRFV